MFSETCDLEYIPGNPKSILGWDGREPGVKAEFACLPENKAVVEDFFKRYMSQLDESYSTEDASNLPVLGWYAFFRGPKIFADCKPTGELVKISNKPFKKWLLYWDNNSSKIVYAPSREIAIRLAYHYCTNPDVVFPGDFHQYWDWENVEGCWQEAKSLTNNHILAWGHMNKHNANCDWQLSVDPLDNFAKDNLRN